MSLQQGVMSVAPPPFVWIGRTASTALITLASLTSPALAQAVCPLVVPADQSFFQPKRIKPDQVQGKNAMGCLSPADAVYGADGCPLRMCGANAGVIQLPEP